MKLRASPTNPPLEADALAALTKVQNTVQRLVGSLPGPFERPAHLQHYLGIDAKVAWHVFKLAAAKDPLAAAPHVPGRLLMKRIGQAALRKGVSPAIIESAQSAIGEFDVIVKKHASTRTAFKAIVATVAGDQPAEAMALQQRHTAFNMLSQLWGEQVDLYYSQAIFVRRDDRTTTTGLVTVKSGLQLLRADASSRVEGYLRSDQASSKVQPLEPQAAEQYGSSLMPSFCSQPIPKFSTVQRSNGWLHTLFQNKQIGRRGAVDIAFGRRVDADVIGRLENGDRIVIHGTQFVTPTATGVLEFLVHRASFPGAQPQFALFGELAQSSMENLVDFGRRLPSFGTLQNLGTAADITAPPHEALPHYDRMQRHVFSKLAWDREDFDLYRITLSFPILHTMGAIWFKL